MAAPVRNSDTTAVAFGVGETSYVIGAQTSAPAGVPIFVVLELHTSDTVTPHTGFTLVFEQVGGTNRPAIHVYKKESSGSESGNYTFTLTTGTSGSIDACWFSGADNTTPVPSGHAAGWDSSTVSVTDIEAPSVTTTRDDCFVLRCFMQRGGVQTQTLSGLTTIFNAGHRGAAGHQTQATAGATGTNTATGSSLRSAAVTVAIQPAEATAPDPATISREGADIAAQEQTDTTAHVRVDTVDTTAGNTHKLWGHTSNLGEGVPATWESTATDLGAVTTNDLVGWASRTPNTAYFFAVVSTDSGSNKTQSAVLTITTAYARPTSPAIVGKTATTVTVSATDASSGLADHMAFVRASADPLSDLEHKGTVAAGETIQFEFTDLVAGTEYSFEFVAWDGGGGAGARFSGLTATTAVAAPLAAAMYSYRRRRAA